MKRVDGERERKLQYEPNYQGEWVVQKRRGNFIGCCDCGLVHTVNFRMVRGRIEMQVFRNPGETRRCRAQLKREGKHVRR